MNSSSRGGEEKEIELDAKETELLLQQEEEDKQSKFLFQGKEEQRETE